MAAVPGDEKTAHKKGATLYGMDHLDNFRDTGSSLGNRARKIRGAYEAFANHTLCHRTFGQHGWPRVRHENITNWHLVCGLGGYRCNLDGCLQYDYRYRTCFNRQNNTATWHHRLYCRAKAHTQLKHH